MNYFIQIVSAAGPIDTAPRVAHVLTNILQFLLSMIGIVAIIALVIGGVMFFLAGGDVRQVRVAKKIVLSAVIGIVIALGSIVLIRSIGSFFG